MKYSLEGVQAQQNKEYSVCPSAQLRTLITPKGVYVCPYWRGKNRFKLGDIKNMSISEIWASDEKKKVMKNLDPKKDCQFHCLRHETNLAALRIKQDNKDKFLIADETNNQVFDRFI